MSEGRRSKMNDRKTNNRKRVKAYDMLLSAIEELNEAGFEVTALVHDVSDQQNTNHLFDKNKIMLAKGLNEKTFIFSNMGGLAQAGLSISNVLNMNNNTRLMAQMLSSKVKSDYLLSMMAMEAS